MAKGLAIAAGGGFASAALYLTVMFDAPGALLLAYLALMPHFVAGLGWGSRAVIVSTGVATAIIASLASGRIGIVFALAYALPAVAMVIVALRQRTAPDGTTEFYPVGRLVSWLAIYACGGFSLLALFGGDGEVESWLREIESAMRDVVAVGSSPEAAVLIKAIAEFFPAIMIASWLIMVLVNAAIAQLVLERSGHNLRPRPQAATIELPEWFMAVTAGAAALALLAPAMEMTALGFAARNSALALLVPYFFVGLAVVHVWARRWPARPFILAGFYLLMLMFGGIGVLLVAGLGFMEQWLGLRRRFARGGQEDGQ